MQLKPYEFNEQYFDLLKGTDYEALKNDIAKRGILNQLHVLPDGTVICGNQRLRAANELKIPHTKIPVKVVGSVKTPEQIKEYVIKDNLLRRHLEPEKRAYLLDELSKLYEVGRGGDVVSKDANMASLEQEDVNEKTSEIVKLSPRTVARARAYVHAVKKNPK